MLKSRALIALCHEVILWGLRYLSLSVVGIAASLNVSAAQDAGLLIPVPAFRQAAPTNTWEAGPVLVSLIASAQSERPIAWIEPAAVRIASVQPTTLALPQCAAAPVVLVDAHNGFAHGCGVELTQVSFSSAPHR